MSDPISLTELRERRGQRISGGRGIMAEVAQWELLALIAAVEAAQRTINPTCRCDVCTAIREALTPFQP
jgi:hypothetical protein